MLHVPHLLHLVNKRSAELIEPHSKQLLLSSWRGKDERKSILYFAVDSVEMAFQSCTTDTLCVSFIAAVDGSAIPNKTRCVAAIIGAGIKSLYNSESNYRKKSANTHKPPLN